jgi:hypothetical protein
MYSEPSRVVHVQVRRRRAATSTYISSSMWRKAAWTLGDAGRIGDIGLAAEAHRLHDLMAGRCVARRMQRRPHHAAAEARLRADEEPRPPGKSSTCPVARRVGMPSNAKAAAMTPPTTSQARASATNVRAQRRGRQQREALPDRRVADDGARRDLLAEPALRGARLDAGRRAVRARRYDRPPSRWRS